jgi:hypothetical protein
LGTEGRQRHGPDCGCTRCRGFEKGNAVATKHGAYAVVQLGPRVDELTDLIRPHVPGYVPGDEVGLRLLCLSIARLERSATALETVADPDASARLRQDERGWANTVRRYLNDFRLTPASRERAGVERLVTESGEVITLRRLVEAADAEVVDEEPAS